MTAGEDGDRPGGPYDRPSTPSAAKAMEGKGSGRTGEGDADMQDTTVRAEPVEVRGQDEKKASPSPRPSPIEGEGEEEGADLKPSPLMGEGGMGVTEDAGKKAAHGWHEDLEVQIYNAVRWRLDHREGMPVRETVFAMEEPIYRLVDAASLFCDLAFAAKEYDPPKPRSLVSLAKTFRRETERLYQLYIGKNP